MHIMNRKEREKCYALIIVVLNNKDTWCLSWRYIRWVGGFFLYLTDKDVSHPSYFFDFVVG